MHFGAVCDPGISHAMNMTAICDQIKNRGHQVTLFCFPQFEKPELASGFEVWPSPLMSDNLEERVAWISQAQGLKSEDFIRFSIERAKLSCQHVPEALRSAKVDCVLVDGVDPGAASSAEMLGLPFVTINNSLPLNQEASVPPDFLPWLYGDTQWERVRNWTAYRVRDFVIRPIHKVLNRYRSKWGLKPLRSPDDSFSKYAQISQLTQEFDYPRKHLPAWFHYVGPYRREAGANQSFPYEKLDGRPLIYASLGTVHGSRAYLWDAIAAACAGLNAQLVMALGRCNLPPRSQPWPGHPIIVDYAPQRELLGRASLAILHGGMNSAMEALAAGDPTVVIPVIGDQFGVAARVVYSGAGESLPANLCNGERLRILVEKVLRMPSYTERAREMQRGVERTGGAAQAADIVVQVGETKKPVLRTS